MNKVQKNWLEWVVFAIGFVLVAFTLGYLIYAGLTLGDTPPSLEVRLGVPEKQAHSFIVPVTVLNHGDETAASVHVEVVMESEGAEEDRGRLDIAFVPRHSKREGWVTFQQDPSKSQLKARVLGYERP
jgi:uncharacterized protein (TIGR02588 family)